MVILVSPAYLHCETRIQTNITPPAVDVNIYASSPKHAPGLVGNHENTDVGAFMAEYLDLDLEPITKELREKDVEMGRPDDGETNAVDSNARWQKWMGPVDLPEAGEDEGEGAQAMSVDDYHGDWKHRRREAAHVGTV